MRLNARIGVLHIGTESVSAALVKTGGMPAVLGYAREKILESPADMEPSEVLIEAVRAAARPYMSQAEAWVLCVDSSWSVARRLTIPFRGRSRVRPAVAFELEPHLPFPIEEVSVDYALLAERPGETDVLAVAVRRNVLEEQTVLCRAAGVPIEGIGLDVIGLTALFDEKYQDAAQKIVLEVFEEHAALIVLKRRRLNEFVMLPIGARQIQARPTEAWRGVANAVRSLETVDLTADELLRIHLCRGSEHAEPMDGILGPNVNLVVEDQLLPAPTVNNPADDRMRDALAGCALAAAGGGISLNFLDAGLSAGVRPPGLIRRIAAAAGLVAALLVVLFVFRFLEYRANAQRIDALGQEIHKVLAETYPDIPEAQNRPAGDIGGFKSFEILQSAADAEAEGSAMFSPEVFQSPTLLDLLLEVANRTPRDLVTVTDMKITTGRTNELTVYGRAKSAEALNSMLASLRKSPMLKLDERRLTRSSAGGAETFEIVAWY